MRIENTPEYLEAIVSKKELIDLYIIKRIDKETIASSLGVCVSTLNKVIRHYGLIKENKTKPLEYLIENINREKFIQYYKTHNIENTAKYYNTIPKIISQYCKYIGYQKGQYLEDKSKISKEDIIQYYIIEDHGWSETAKHFGISTWSFDKLKNEYGISKYDKCER